VDSNRRHRARNERWIVAANLILKRARTMQRRWRWARIGILGGVLALSGCSSHSPGDTGNPPGEGDASGDRGIAGGNGARDAAVDHESTGDSSSGNPPTPDAHQG